MKRIKKYRSVLHENKNILSVPFTYRELFEELQSNRKEYEALKYMVTYETRNNQFYLISKKDRDYNTPFSMSINDFLKTRSEVNTIKELAGY